jgi:hypothetical protein
MLKKKYIIFRFLIVIFVVIVKPLREQTRINRCHSLIHHDWLKRKTAKLSFLFSSLTMATSNENINGHLVILGATGATGLHLVQQALARGYKVTAPVRNPQKLVHVENKNLEV